MCSFFNLGEIGQMDPHGSLGSQGMMVVEEVKE
jgi:hypothetical protein